MIKVTVRQECGPAHDLAARITGAVHQTAPLVEQATGLPLGDTVTVRLVSPRQFATANRTMFREMVGATFPALELSPRRTKALTVGFSLGAAAMMRSCWVAVAGQYIPPLAGREGQILIMPRALRHQRAHPDALVPLLAHELTHQAQHLRAPGLMRDALLQLCVQARTHMRAARDADGDADAAAADAASAAAREALPEMSALYEGHAQWAHVQISHQVLGTQHRLLPQAGPASLRARLTRRAMRRVPGILEKVGDYERGEQFVRHVLDTRDLHDLNRVWESVEHVPTRNEIGDPGKWITRVLNEEPAGQPVT